MESGQVNLLQERKQSGYGTLGALLRGILVLQVSSGLLSFFLSLSLSLSKHYILQKIKQLQLFLNYVIFMTARKFRPHILRISAQEM